jgi:hypothetical protein
MTTALRLSSAAIAILAILLPLAAQEPTPRPLTPAVSPTADELKEFAKLSEPGPENERLAKLSGNWSVEMVYTARSSAPIDVVGKAEAKAILGGRFVDVTFTVDKGPVKGEHRYTLGFDRRHGEYTIVAADTTGTYFVTARGKPDAERPDQIRMHGTDNDPIMKRRGLDKKFQFVLRLSSDNTFSVEIVFVDTRTKENNQLPFAAFIFKRATK